MGPGIHLDTSEKAIALNSGIMLVVPAWKIRELLEIEELAAMRKKDEQDLTERDEQSHAVMDSADSEESGRVSLAPLSPEEALRALLQTPRAEDEK
jgi:hypothetical protein